MAGFFSNMFPQAAPPTTAQAPGGTPQGANNQSPGAAAPAQGGLYPSVPADPQVASQAQAQVGGAGVVPGANTPSGMDAFTSLWKAADPSQGQPGSLFATSQQQIGEAVSKLPMPNLDPARVQAALGGDAQAFQDILGETMRHAMSTTLFLNTQMMNGAHERQVGMVRDSLPSMVTEQLGRGELTRKYPVLSHPAAKPMFDMVMQAARRDNPQATPAELTEKVAAYLQEFSGGFATKPEGTGDQSNKTSATEPDWLTYASAQPGQPMSMQGSLNDLSAL